MFVLKLAPVWLCFLLCFLLAWMAARRDHIARDWRLYWVMAALANGFFQVLIAEVAGAFNSFDRATVAAAWIEVDVALAGLMAWRLRADLADLNLGKSLLEGLKNFRSQPVLARLIWALGLAFAIFLGGLALQAPTSIADCQNFHAARIMHWVQNKGLGAYACNMVWQVCYPPGSEIASATLYLLNGSDRPLNLPSWFALFTSALLASFITELLAGLHAERTGRVWPKARLELAAAVSFVLVMTLPAAVGQALSTETDVFTAMWNLCLAALVVLFLRQPANVFYAAAAGLSLALGICAQGATLIAAAPFLAGAFVLLIWRRSFRAAIQLAGIIALTGLIINGPWALRNIRAFGHPFGPARVTAQLRTGDLSPSQCAANIVRHLSLYAATPSTNVTKALNDLAYTLVFCTGRPLDDSASIYYRYPFHLSSWAGVAGGWGWGNIQAWLIFLALAGLVAGFRLGNALGFYAAAVCLGFCLACSCLRWQPECYRCHLPYFVMAMPLVAIFLGAVAPRAVMALLVLLCLANAMLILFYNPYYPVDAQARFQDKPRQEQMFCLRPFLYRPYVGLAEDIVGRGCTNVLLKVSDDPNEIGFEYALWDCLHERGFHGAIEHFEVTNETAKLSRGATNARTALVFIDTPPSGPSSLDGHPVVTVIYAAEVAAQFSAAHPGRWLRLLGPDNQATVPYNLAGFVPNKPARVFVSCKPVDRNGLPITNNVLRVAPGDVFGDVDLRSNSVNVAAAVNQPFVLIRIALLKPVPPEQSPASLSDLNVSFSQPKSP